MPWSPPAAGNGPLPSGGAPAPAAAAAPNKQAGGIDRATAAKFFPGIWQRAGGDPDKFLAEMGTNKVMVTHFKPALEAPEVLDFARPVHLDVAPASLHAICRQAVDACVAAEPQPAVSLTLDDAADTIQTDADRLRGVLVNLIANAREAVRAAERPPGAGHVSVGTRRASGAVVIEVTDTGTGIEPAMAGQVFEPYFTTRRKGTGLGLAIARNIIEGLGGTIALTSTPGTGTVVRITLPQENAHR